MMENILENKMAIIGFVSAIALLIVFLNSMYKVDEHDIAIIARFGKYNKEVGSGIHFKVPFIERVDGRVSTKEMMAKFPVKTTVTKDKVPVKPEMVAYFKVTVPHLFNYKIDDSDEMLDNILETVLRDTINSMTVEETVSSRELIKKKIMKSLEDTAETWGIEIIRVEIKDIDVPNQIRLTLEQNAKEELERKNKLAKAEAESLEKIKRAEAEKEAAIVRAQGEAEAIKIVKEAHYERRKAEDVHVPRSSGVVSQVYEEVSTMEEDYEVVDLGFDDSEYN